MSWHEDKRFQLVSSLVLTKIISLILDKYIKIEYSWYFFSIEGLRGELFSDNIYNMILNAVIKTQTV